MTNWVKKSYKEDDYIFSPDFFDEKSMLFWSKFHTAKKTRHPLKAFFKKYHEHTNDLLKIKSNWIAKKIRSLFRF